jgi:uridine phosphorylase
MKQIKDSELIINPDGSIYHIKLREEHIADDVIVVGDQGRVKVVSKYFDTIEHEISNREFFTHTGTYNGRRITVMSTGIGTDNVDIVLNELDAAINIDLTTRMVKENKRKLNIVRIGTSGSLQPDLAVDSFLVSSHGVGFDPVLHFYKDKEQVFDRELMNAFIKHAKWEGELSIPYFIKGSTDLHDKLLQGDNVYSGMTATAAGFYGPQGRELRLASAIPDLNEVISAFSHNGLRITNFEMETSTLFGLGRLLGHNCCTICALIANRYNKTFSKDYKTAVDKLVKYTLDKLTE